MLVTKHSNTFVQVLLLTVWIKSGVCCMCVLEFIIDITSFTLDPPIILVALQDCSSIIGRGLLSSIVSAVYSSYR